MNLEFLMVLVNLGIHLIQIDLFILCIFFLFTK